MTRLPRNWSRATLALAAAALLCTAAASPAWAEDDEPAANDVREQIKQQMEKVRELMQRNESALMELSTGGQAEARRVDVEIPPTPPGSKGPGGGGEGDDGSGSGSGSDGASAGGSSGAGTSGEAAVKQMDDLVRGASETSEVIPDELKRLVKMIPL